jgi:hypothetical protein
MAAFRGRPKKFSTITLSATITSQQIMKITRNLIMDNGELDIA